MDKARSKISYMISMSLIQIPFAQGSVKAKICCISRIALTAWIKYLKFRKEEKLFTPPQYHKN
ncbi:hypothetical protein GOY07_00710 [Wolbachia endosymbiont of Litomosoides sigmodontis]|nr:hypothetical protein GOY07_00710 [Wolbachia endosymbiont of Litomosoides sigmodontis]